MQPSSPFARDTKVMDCTLRDGGYYTRWDFEPAVVSDYLDAMARSHVDAVEIGFRNPHWPGFVGKLGFSTATQLSDLAKAHPKLGVMTDTKVLTAKEGSVNRALLESLYGSESDPATFVRLATLPKDLGVAATAAAILADWGYEVFINLMQASTLDRGAFDNLANPFRGLKVAAVYLADSFGSLYPERTRQLVKDAREAFRLPIGFHAHDNLGLANANALAAAEAGAAWIDCTVMGMGRGAGNARTENILPIFRGLGRQDLVPAALGRLVDQHFRPLQQRYEWGPSLAFALSALAEIHPTYAQKLLAGTRYSSGEVLDALAVLQNEPSRGTFSEQLLLKGRSAANGWTSTPSREQLQAIRRLVPTVGTTLVVGAGPSLQRYRDGVQAVAGRCDLVVLTNATPAPSGAARKLRTVIHRRHAEPVRALRDRIAILHPFPDNEGRELFGTESISLPCELAPAAVSAEGVIRIPSDVVGMYAIELALVLGSSKVLLAGFDGYAALGSIDKDPDNMGKEALLTTEMNSYLAAVRSRATVEMASVTPTWYDIPVVSPYETN